MDCCTRLAPPLSQVDFDNAEIFDAFLEKMDPESRMANFSAALEHHRQEPATPGPSPRSVLRQVRSRWPNGEVPYTLDAAFDEEFRTVIASAISSVHSAGCVRWRPKTVTDEDWVAVRTRSVTGCWASQGFLGPGAGEHVMALQGPHVCRDRVGTCQC